MTQVMSLLIIAHVIIHAMWKFKIDPDSSSIPYLTALGDLLGSSLLLGAFIFLRHIGHEYEERPDPMLAEFLSTANPFITDASF